ncbi:MAG: hypothetical protein FJ296_03120 [Planctomycetes bacterium]|nr:hypothetical protein [Planctomycetota bacterium]
MSRCVAILALLLAGLGVARLSSPAQTAGFVMSGEQLDLGQRDARLAATFSDAAANDNVVAQPEFPGTLGAALAVRKAHVEWSSQPWAGTPSGTVVVLQAGFAEAAAPQGVVLSNGLLLEVP